MNDRAPDRPGIRHRVVTEDLPVYGGWLTVPSAEFLAAMSASALDYVGIDCQHTLISETDAARLLVGAGASRAGRLIRVSANRHELIAKTLDGGADGVIVPTVNDAGEARAAVAAARFPPDGVRSYGPMAGFLPRDPAALAGHALVLPMIETKEGLTAVEEILAVPGIDGVYVGPADLGISLGLGPGQFPATAELEPALRRIAKAARSAGKIAGIHAGSELFAERYIRFGFRLLTLGTQHSFVAAGVSRALEQAGATPPGPQRAATPYGQASPVTAQ